MKRLFLFIIILNLLVACSSNQANDKKQKAITEQETEQLAVSFVEVKKGKINDIDGFFIRFAIKQLSGEPFETERYSFTLQDILIDKNERRYKAITSELLTTDQAGDPLPEDTVHFQQFFGPLLSNDLTTLPVTFYIKPTYYEREIIFEDVSPQSTPLQKNDLTIERIAVNDKKLSLFITDVHDTKGIEVTLLIDGETIFPVFSNTEYGKLSNSVAIDFEFALPLPESFSLKVTRYRLNDVVKSLSFHVPIYYPY